jgi:hypothetical protein
MKRYDHNQMQNLYEQWRASEMSKIDFALTHQIRPATFYYWIRKFEKTVDCPASGFQRVSIEEPTHHNSQGELMAAIHYPSGIRLELYSSFQHLGDSYTELLKSLTR